MAHRGSSSPTEHPTGFSELSWQKRLKDLVSIGCQQLLWKLRLRLTMALNPWLDGFAKDTQELKPKPGELERFFNLALDMFCIAGFDGYFKSFNSAFETILGYTGTELLAIPFINFVHPEDRGATSVIMEQLISGETEKLSDFENRYRCKDGSYKWLAWTYMALASEGLIYGVARDISDRIALEKELALQEASFNSELHLRKLAEEELRQSSARFREVANREALLNRLANQIRRSLDLNTILKTAVQEIRNLLQIDRSLFLWYRPDSDPPVWEVVQEERNPDFPSLINDCVPVTAFGPISTRALNKEITRVDCARDLIDPVEQKYFFRLGYTALLALPIHTTSGEIGLVSCSHSSDSRLWRDNEVELLQSVADQIAIAIDQAQLLHQSQLATQAAQKQATQLKLTLWELQQAQAQLVQSEKMSSLGQLVGGIAHEINNPISFIYGNLSYVKEYSESLLNLIQLYQQYYPDTPPEIQAPATKIDLDFIEEDLPKILSSMKMGADRIRQIVSSLRNFSRLDEAEMKWVDIHEGIDNTLLILAHRLKVKRPDCPDIQVIKDYNNLPKVQCYPGELNQVFMNILTNAIEAIEEHQKGCSPEGSKNHTGTILISTEILPGDEQVLILIADNGLGMTQAVCRKVCDPFFTTKPIGSGTGLGMSISYQIVVEKHGGQLQCISAPGQGTAFIVQIPVQQETRAVKFSH